MNEKESFQAPRHGRKSNSLGLLFVALFLAAGHFVYRARVAPRRPRCGRKPRLELTAHTLVPQVHILGGLKPSAAYVVETSQGLVLIDSGLKPPRVGSSRRWANSGSIGAECVPSCSRMPTETIAEGPSTCGR